MLDQPIKSNTQDNLVADLAGLFELLARFDYEDKRKSGFETGSLASAPKESVSVSDITMSCNEAENKRH